MMNYRSIYQIIALALVAGALTISTLAGAAPTDDQSQLKWTQINPQSNGQNQSDNIISQFMRNIYSIFDMFSRNPEPRPHPPGPHPPGPHPPRPHPPGPPKPQPTSTSPIPSSSPYESSSSTSEQASEITTSTRPDWDSEESFFTTDEKSSSTSSEVIYTSSTPFDNSQTTNFGMESSPTYLPKTTIEEYLEDEESGPSYAS